MTKQLQHNHAQARTRFPKSSQRSGTQVATQPCSSENATLCKYFTMIATVATQPCSSENKKNEVMVFAPARSCNTTMLKRELALQRMCHRPCHRPLQHNHAQARTLNARPIRRKPLEVATQPCSSENLRIKEVFKNEADKLQHNHAQARTSVMPCVRRDLPSCNTTMLKRELRLLCKCGDGWCCNTTMLKRELSRWRRVTQSRGVATQPCSSENYLLPLKRIATQSLIARLTYLAEIIGTTRPAARLRTDMIRHKHHVTRTTIRTLPTCQF